jgi:histidinol-phosphate aminotransferase
MAKPRIVEMIERLPASTPFVGPEALERQRGGLRFRARIGANESVFGPSPKAVAAMAKGAAECWMYGDPEIYDLKAAIARYHRVNPNSLAIDCGSDALLGLTVRLTTAPGDVVVTSLGAYPTFSYHVDACGGRLLRVPYRGDHEDPQALLEMARREDARLIYLANPDNPMGSWLAAGDVQRMIDGVPDGALLIIDEAYSDTAPPGSIPPLDPSNPSVIRMRTFSKAYGMAGARVGYAVGAPEVIQHFDKVRNHFDVSRISQEGALAALADQDYLVGVVRKIERGRGRIGQIAAANGLRALPSATNFVAVDCGRDGAYARAVLSCLIKRGIFVRMPNVAPLDRCVRISVGTDQDLDLLAEMLPQALREAAQPM